MKNILSAITLGVTLLATTGFAQAGPCGSGIIKKINEGGWNASNDLYIALDLPSGTQPPTTSWAGAWVRFTETSLTPEKLKAIRAMAYLAFANGNEVKLQSSSNNCSQATEITIFRTGIGAS